jgi:prepilin-type N-terminal cleavage/methylation domain-containing protein
MLKSALRRRRGFTIIEILIAIVVLVLGITGIVALFPTAIESGNQTVEDTYAATITQSVVDAISVGLRESRYSYRTQPPNADRVWTYFVFNHDGVIDQMVQQPEVYDLDTVDTRIWQRDYCVLLPQATSPGANFNTDTELTFVFPFPYLEGRAEAHLGIDQRKFDVLQTTTAATLDPLNFVGPGANGNTFRRTTSEGTPALWYVRTYPLGHYRLGDPNIPGTITNYNQSVGQVRTEYRGEDVFSSGGNEQTIAVDPYPTYSFSFTLKRARVDTMSAGPTPPAGPGGDGRITINDHFSNSLYELQVYIFKNFSPAVSATLADPETGSGGQFPPVPRTNRPVRRFITLVSL